DNAFDGTLALLLQINALLLPGLKPSLSRSGSADLLAQLGNECRESEPESHRHTTYHGDEGREHNSIYASVVSAAYALRRGGNREETLIAVDNLAYLCNFGGELSVPAVQYMMDGGALQCLLSTLARAGEWPEVEKQITKIVSVLVTYEEDWALLQRSATFILTALYTLQVKSLSQSRLRSQERQREFEGFSTSSPTGRSRTASCASLSAPLRGLSDSFDISGLVQSEPPPPPPPPPQLSPALRDLNLIVKSGLINATDSVRSGSKAVDIERYSDSLGLPLDQDVQGEFLRRQEEDEEEQENMKALLSAAVAKMSLVLACEWGKLPAPLGGFASIGGGTRDAGGQIGSRPGSFPSRGAMPAVPGGEKLVPGARRNSLSSLKGPAGVKNDRALSILLNLIENLADQSPGSCPSPRGGEMGSLGVAAITKILVKSSTKSQPQTSNPPPPPPPPGAGFDGDLGTYNPSEGKGQSGETGGPGLSLHIPGLETDPIDQDEILSQGAVFFSPLMRVDSAAVLCSAAMCSLAEVPQCRPGLVSSGALRQIRAWLEIGTDVLAQARVLCSNKLSSPNRGQRGKRGKRAAPESEALRESCGAFMEAFGPAYELISNAAAALMYLCGGDDIRFPAQSEVVLVVGGRDYIVGWIDAQILAERLPAVVVRMIHTSIEALPCTEGKSATRSVLPAAVGMHLAQTLFQLCSRVQNRHQLKSMDIPYTLCILFENITTQTKLITNSPFYQHQRDQREKEQREKGEQRDEHESPQTPTAGPAGPSPGPTASGAQEREDPNRSKVHPEDDIYAYIFHFGGIYSRNIGREGLRRESSEHLPLLSIEKRRGRRGREDSTGAGLGGLGAGHRHGHALPDAPEQAPCTQKARPRYVIGKTYSSTCGQTQTTMPPMSLFQDIVSEDLLPLMSSVTSSCLEALTHFFTDEMSKLPFGQAEELGFGSAFSIADLMCSEHMIDAIKMASSFLPRGEGRLAALRVVSALTEWPACTAALHEVKNPLP
ncbi:hypothetical protein B484DRAFT_388927, partial [Ochromonadaceae sp. CCMP2298]